MNWVAIGGGMDQPTIYSLAHFLRAIPDGSMLTVESSMRNVLPINMMGMAMGLHVRCGIEDNLWNQSRTDEDDHRAADRAAGAHRRASSAARWPAARKRARSARSACSTTRWKRRWPPTASPRTPRADSRASCARRPEVEPPTSRPSSSSRAARRTSPQHWQTLLEAPARRRARRRQRAAHGSRGPELRRASRRRSSAPRRRSKGRSSSSRTAAAASWWRTGRADPARACMARCCARRPTSRRRCPTATRRSPPCAPAAGCRCRAQRLPFPSIVAASRNDPLGSYAARQPRWPTTGAAAGVDLGKVGHLNPASGFGDWPHGRTPSSRELFGTSGAGDH